MRLPHIRPATTRIKIIALALIAVAAITVPVAAPWYQGEHARTEAAATGPLSIIWGDPYLAPQTAQGTGSESLTITGVIAEKPNMTGYYEYTSISLSGTLQAQWSDQGNTYILDASFSLSSYSTRYQETTIQPSTNSFYVSFMDYTATLSVNGATTRTAGEAGLKAAAPGYFAQEGQSRVTTFIIYAPSLGLPQFVIRWSQTNQMIGGVQLPAANQFSQTIKTTGWS